MRPDHLRSRTSTLPVPAGAQAYDSGRDRILELPRGFRNYQNWFFLLVSLVLSVGAWVGVGFASTPRERTFGVLGGVVALVMAAFGIHALFSRTRIVVTPSDVTVETNGPLRRSPWTASRKEFEVGETLGSSKGRCYVELFSPRAHLEIMDGFPRDQAEQVRVLLEDWTRDN